MIVRAEVENIAAGGGKVTITVETMVDDNEDATEAGNRLGHVLHEFATGIAEGTEEAAS